MFARRRVLLLAPLLVILVAGQGRLAAATAPTTFAAVADSYVSAAAPAANYGTQTQIRVDGSPVVRSYLRFSLSGLGGAVTSATLRVFANSAQSTGFSVYSVADTGWSETALTYGNAPALGALRGASGAVSAGTWKAVDVTAAVTGNGAYAFALTTTNATALGLASREAGANAPQLVVSTAGSQDVTAPDAPSGLVVTGASASRVDLSWVAAHDDVGVTAYRVLRGGVEVGRTTTQTTFADTTVQPSTGYSYTVTALDAAGHESLPSAAVSVTTPAASAGSVTVVPAADAYVSAAAPTANYGTQAQLRVDGSPVVRSYLRFSLSGLGGAVTSATLRVFANSAQSTGFSVYSVADTGWSETALTYGNAPALGALRGASGAVSAGTWKSVDVTAAVTGNGAYAFALTTTNATALSLASREAGANAPQLVITTSGSPPPPPPAASLQVGAYYYGWYSSAGRHWADGYLRHRLAPSQQPQLGEYDSRAASTIATQLGWAQRYGIDYLISSWWGQGSYEDVTTHDYLLPSPAIGSTKVALMYESLALLPVTSGVINFDATTEAKLVSDVDYMARAYFSNPHYLRVDGKPVLYFYVSRIWRGDYAHAIATLRATIRQRYGYDLYLVGDEVDWDGTPVPDRIKLFDAITAYTMYSDTQTPGWPDSTGYLTGVRDRYVRFKAAADASGVRFIPDALPGFNDRGVRLAVDHYVLPPELHAGADGSFGLFRGFLDLDASFLDPVVPMLDVTSFNEWHEDTEIEPTAAGTATATPTTYTQGYTYTAHGLGLLDALQQFRAAHGF